MVRLAELFVGAQDAYIYGQNSGQRKCNTLTNEFVETRSVVIKGDVEKKGPMASNTYFEQRRRGCVSMKHKDDGPELAYTGLRFQGDPSVVNCIELEVGGQRLDKIYPSITGQFESFNLFEVVFPNPTYHSVEIYISFLKEAELKVEWDVVKITEEEFKENKYIHELLHSQTQYTGAEEIKEGESEIRLNYNHPVESITIYTENPVESMVLAIHSNCRYHIPYVGVQNNKHVYKYVFQAPVNFSRMDRPSLRIKSATDNVVYPFAKSKNVMRFMSGMAGSAFSK